MLVGSAKPMDPYAGDLLFYFSGLVDWAHDNYPCGTREVTKC